MTHSNSIHSYIEDYVLVNSVIGEGTTFRGNLELVGLLRIDGRYFGKIKSSGTVVVGKGGYIEGTIEADSVVIGGRMIGDVIASSKVIMLADAHIEGHVHASRMISEVGAKLECKFVVKNMQNSLKK